MSAKWLLLFAVVLTSCKAQKQSKANQQSGIMLSDGYFVNIQDFGAVPDDNKDDSKAIQAAIDHAINSNKTSIVFCPPGLYTLQSGVVIANKANGNEYKNVTLTLTGPIPAYSADQRIGSVASFDIVHQGFGVAIQKGRNCLVQNIVFKGNTIYKADPALVISSSATSWESVESRRNLNSPEAGIVIDPFHASTDKTNRYPGFDSYYTNSSVGGTSMCSIKGCSFSNLYIALANNPSSGVSNGDNISMQDCHVASCFTLWSCGLTQSRSNSIKNVYATFVHTLISGNQIGRRTGTPPFVTLLNLAGCCKYVAELRSGFTGAHFSQCYFESVWSHGVYNVNHVAFDNCQIKFLNLNNKYFTPPFHIFTKNTVDFSNSSLEYFDNCRTPVALSLYSQSLKISGGFIEAGVVVPNGITNNGGDEIHLMKLDNAVLRCQNSIALQERKGLVISKLANQVMPSNALFTTSDGRAYTNTGSTLEVIHVEKQSVQVDPNLPQVTFTTSYPGAYKVRDNLFSSQVQNINFGYLNTIQVRTYIGFVSEVKGNSITVQGIGEHLKSEPYHISIVDYRRFYPELKVKTTAGSSDVIIESSTCDIQPVVGMRLNHPLFPLGTFVTGSDKNALTVSAPATKSVQRVKLFHQASQFD